MTINWIFWLQKGIIIGNIYGGGEKTIKMVKYYEGKDCQGWLDGLFY
jgi:hypothetical protein